MNTAHDPAKTPSRTRRRTSPAARWFGVAAVLFLFVPVGCKNLPNLREAKTNVDVGVDVLNKYVWRGMVTSNVAVAQPSVNIANSGFAINVWGTMDLKEAHDRDNQFQFTEIDATLSYAHTIECVSLSGGVIHYVFPNSGLPSPGSSPGSTTKDGDTTEAFVSAGLPGIPLSPTLSGNMDLDEACGGSYLNLGVSHSFDVPFTEMPSFSTIDVSAGVGWGSSEHNRLYFPDTPNPGSGLVDFTATLSIPIDLGDQGDSGWTVTPTITYSSLLDSDVRHAHGSRDWNIIWGVSLGISF